MVHTQEIICLTCRKACVQSTVPQPTVPQFTVPQSTVLQPMVPQPTVLSPYCLVHSTSICSTKSTVVPGPHMVWESEGTGENLEGTRFYFRIYFYLLGLHVCVHMYVCEYVCVNMCP